MPRVVSAVELDDEVGVLAELISGLTFAFVAPLGAEHDDGGHEYLRKVWVRRAGVRNRPILAEIDEVGVPR